MSMYNNIISSKFSFKNRNCKNYYSKNSLKI